MLHHPGGTIGALKTITAMPAKRERRITPPIEEQERLFALFPNLIHCPDQLRRYPAAALGRIAGEIDGLDLRQFRASSSEEHTSELQSLMRITYALFSLKNQNPTHTTTITHP